MSSESEKIYDLIVIGGGSGGLACAKRAASYNASVVVIEGGRYGGTCVNVGCVPKKIMFNTSHVMETLNKAREFGITFDNTTFNWGLVKKSRDRYIQRLNGIYEGGLDKLKIERVNGWASFLDRNTVQVNGGKTYRGKHILIATGGKPAPVSYPGNEFVIDSNGFFELEEQPKKVAVIGAGYIAVELAGVFNGLGTDTSLFCRHDNVLRYLDPVLNLHLKKEMDKHGPRLIPHSIVSSVVKENDGTFTLNLENGSTHGGFNCVLSAIGRLPNTDGLNLPGVGVELDNHGYIKVDDYQNSTVSNIYALGDVIGKVELTPMAIAAGRRLSDRLFGGILDAKADYENVPTVIFSHPVIATVGYTEAEAVEAYGQEHIKCYVSDFVNLYYATYFAGESGDKPVSKYKVVCLGPEERVVGIHLIGKDSDEIIQGFAVAMKMGATKADFDNCVAIHPTAGEELVTLPPWGLSGIRKDGGLGQSKERRNSQPLNFSP